MDTQKTPQRRRLSPLSVILLTLLVLGVGAVALWTLRELPGEDIHVPEDIQQDFLPVNQWSRPGTSLEEVNGVVIHYVGNPNTSAKANRNYFASLSTGELETYASSHFIVGLEGEVVQCIPLTEISYGSNSRNDDTIAVEVCHPDETGEFSPVTYGSLVKLTAWLCEEFRLDPETQVIRHYDVNGKLCPLYYVEHPSAWEEFLTDVKAAVEEKEETPG